MWFTSFEEEGTIIRSVSKPSCCISGAGQYDTTTTGPQWGVYNTRSGGGGLNKYTSYITLPVSYNGGPWWRIMATLPNLSRKVYQISKRITIYYRLTRSLPNFCIANNNGNRTDQLNCSRNPKYFLFLIFAKIQEKTSNNSFVKIGLYEHILRQKASLSSSRRSRVF